MSFRSHMLRCVPVLLFSICVASYCSEANAQFDEFGDSTEGDNLGITDDTSDPLEGFDNLDEGEQEKPPGLILLEEAQAFEEQKSWEEALKKYQELNAMVAGQDAQVSIGLGRCYEQLGATREAISAYSAVLIARNSAQLPDAVSEARLGRGRLFIDEEGRYGEAVEDLAIVLEQTPDNPEAQYLTGRALLLLVMTSPGRGRDQGGQASLQNALDALTKAIELRSDYGEAYLDRGRVLLQLSDYSYSVQDLEKAVQFLGADSDATADLGFAYKARASREASRPSPNQSKVLQDYRKALKSLDDYLNSHSIHEKKAPWRNPDR